MEIYKQTKEYVCEVCKERDITTAISVDGIEILNMCDICREKLAHELIVFPVYESISNSAKSDLAQYVNNQMSDNVVSDECACIIKTLKVAGEQRRLIASQSDTPIRITNSPSAIQQF